MENTKDSMRLTLPRCVIIIPAHNEEKSVTGVIDEIRELTVFPVVVVDDASTDDTILMARKAGAIVVPLAVQLGAWGATQAGLRYAYKNAYTCAVTMDADGQHLAEFLSVLLKPITRIAREKTDEISALGQPNSSMKGLKNIPMLLKTPQPTAWSKKATTTMMYP